MTDHRQTWTNAASSRGDDAVIDEKTEAAPLSDWDVVDQASLDSFPASDPPSWWAGGSQT